MVSEPPSPVLPHIRPEACVHSYAPNAGCTACVDSCPKGAWVLEDAELGFISARCDSCGLCVPACPREAIGLQRPLMVLHDSHGHGTAWAGCEKSPASGACRIACLHAIGTRDLDQLAQDGVSRLSATSGDCANCDRARPTGLAEAAARHAAIRSSRGEPFVALAMLDAATFVRTLARAKEDLEQIDRGRRRLFGRVLALANGQAPPASTARKPLAYWSPKIDAKACNGCDACIRICPDQALHFDQSDVAAYRLSPDSCSGCGLCVDVCDQHAITVMPDAPSEEIVLELDSRRCKSCGASYHRPASQTGDTGAFCRICAHKNHHRSLFQVLGNV